MSQPVINPLLVNKKFHLVVLKQIQVSHLRLRSLLSSEEQHDGLNNTKTLNLRSGMDLFGIYSAKYTQSAGTLFFKDC